MIIDELLNNLGEIIGENRDGENVYNIYNTCKELFKKGEAAFKFDPDKKVLLKGVFFKREDTGKLIIIIGQKYFDTYSKNSSLHHTMLIHELKHLYDCYMLKEEFYERSYKKIHWFEFQARFIEIEFIINYLIGKFTLTRLEDLLLKCYENDDFNYYTIFVSHVSYHVFKQFREFENDYNNNLISLDDIIMEIIRESHQLIMEFLNIEEEYKKYAYYIMIKTFRNCLEDIIFKRDGEPVITFKDIHEKYYLYIEYFYQKLYEIIDCDNEVYKNYIMRLDYSLEVNYTDLITQP